MKPIKYRMRMTFYQKDKKINHVTKIPWANLILLSKDNKLTLP